MDAWQRRPVLAPPGLLTVACARTLALYYLGWQALAGVVTAAAVLLTHSRHPVAAVAVLLLVLNPLIIHQVFFKQFSYSVWPHGWLKPRVRVRVAVVGPDRGPILHSVVLYWAIGWRTFVLGLVATGLMFLLRHAGVPIVLHGGADEITDIVVIFAAFQWFAAYPYGRTRIEARPL